MPPQRVDARVRFSFRQEEFFEKGDLIFTEPLHVTNRFEAFDRKINELVYQSPCHPVDSLVLIGGEIFQRTLQLAPADDFEALDEMADHGVDLEVVHLPVEDLDLFSDDLLGLRELIVAAGEVALDHPVEVIYVEKMHPPGFAAGGLDIPGNGQVDDDQGR